MMRFSLGDCGHETPGDAGQIWTAFGTILVDATNEIVLLVGHNPWTVPIPAIPRRGVTEVEGLHGAVIIIAAVDLGIAVVETAAGVEMLTIDHPVLPLSLIHICIKFANATKFNRKSGARAARRDPGPLWAAFAVRRPAACGIPRFLAA